MRTRRGQLARQLSAQRSSCSRQVSHPVTVLTGGDCSDGDGVQSGQAVEHLAACYNSCDK